MAFLKWSLGVFVNITLLFLYTAVRMLWNSIEMLGLVLALQPFSHSEFQNVAQITPQKMNFSLLYEILVPNDKTVNLYLKYECSNKNLAHVCRATPVVQCIDTEYVNYRVFSH